MRRTTLTVGACLFACSVSSAAPRPDRDLFSGRHFSVGIGPVDMVRADIDGDGSIDLVTANAGSNDISILRHLVTGFAPEVRVAVGATPAAIASGDLNADGRADIVCVSRVDRLIVVLLSNATAGFEAPVLYPLAGEPADVAIGRVDADAVPDVVVVDAKFGGVIALPNLGDGSLDAPVFLVPPGEPKLTVVAMADLDSDGDEDIVYGTETGLSRVLISTGAGMHAIGPYLPVSIGIGFGFIDFDLDGDLDIVSMSRTFVFVSLNRGGLSFDVAGKYEARVSGLADLDVADINGDGWPDAVFAATSTEICRNNAQGSFYLPVAPIQLDDDGIATVCADFDGDGDSDIAVAHPYSNTVGIWTNPGTGAFQFGPQSSTHSHSFATVDFDSDGDLDLIGVPDSAGYFTTLRNDGTGTFTESPPYFDDAPPPDANLSIGPDAADSRWLSYSGVAIGDVNRDGIPDVVRCTPDHYPFGIAASLGDGAGGFGPTAYFHDAIFSHSYAIALGDIDSDGDLDAFVSLGGEGKVGVFLNDGAGAFALGPVIITPADITDIEAADMDIDGDLDLVCASPALDSVHVLWNRDDDGLEVQTFAAGAHPTSIAIGDLNDDGLPDIVVGDQGRDWPAFHDSGISVLLNQGHESFSSVALHPAGRACTSIQLADMDHDGDADIVASYGFSRTVGVLLNDGHAAFADSRAYSCGGGAAEEPESMVVGDFDGDLLTDVCIANVNKYRLTVMVNRSGRSTSFCPADVDGDLAVNAVDFTILATHFGESVPAFTLGDLTGDGLVNVADFVVLAGDFGCTP